MLFRSGALCDVGIGTRVSLFGVVLAGERAEGFAVTVVHVNAGIGRLVAVAGYWASARLSGDVYDPPNDCNREPVRACSGRLVRLQRRQCLAHAAPHGHVSDAHCFRRGGVKPG